MTEPALPSGRVHRIVAGPIGLWTGFGIVHLTLALINLFDTLHLPFGDVVQIYRFWMDYAAQHGVLVGIDTAWVYPVGALLPMGLAYVFGSGPYGLMWLVMVTALDASAFAALVRRRRAAAWWWLAFLSMLGPIALARLDAVTVPLAILGLLWLSARPAIAGAILALGAWIKVWPAALLAAGILAIRSRAAVLLGAALTTLAVLATALLLGGGANVFKFIAEQGARGLQLEAPVSAFWLWEAVLHIGGARIYYDQGINTYEVFGQGTGGAAAAMTPLLIAAVAVVLLLALRALRRDVDAPTVLVPVSLALVLAMIVFNKVGSPQFITWLAAPVVLGLSLRQARMLLPGALVLGIALLTQLFYPWNYHAVLAAEPVAATVLTLRNLALIVAFVVAVRALWQLPGIARRGAEQPTESALIKEA